MTRTIIALLVFAFVLSAPLVGMAEEGMKQTKCPVMSGMKPTKERYADYKGKRVYFCCDYCPTEFKKDPDKYMEKLKKEGIELEDSPNS